MHCNLDESCSEVNNSGLGFVLLGATNTGDAAERGGTPGLAHGKTEKNELGQDLPKAIIG